ncbi:Imm1 family immunity protein [Solwaraspora sp. WMMB335]|uniref:Imm1 family immunity protein n=1 Tax=Solwaraspora sp. WMMB335 TaxID=3404118 RepID=UPI003B956244
MAVADYDPTGHRPTCVTWSPPPERPAGHGARRVKVNWSYDRGDRRESHSTAKTDATALGSLLREIQQRAEPVVVTIYGAGPDSPDELTPGLQLGLGHPDHAFVAYIADDGYHLTAPDVRPPTTGISFDLGGVPTEYAAEHLRLRPETAIAAAVGYLRTGRAPPTLPRPAADRERMTP